MTKKTRFRDFGAGKPVIADPLSFKLHGEEFHCLRQVPGKLLLDLVTSGEDNASAANIVKSFFSRVLTEESYKRFDALLESKDENKIVTMDTLAEITTWLIEEYTNRPERQSEGS